MSLAPQAFPESLDGTDPLGLPGPRAPQVSQEEMGKQGRPARKAASARWAPPDRREARETPAPSALLGTPAWQGSPDQQDHQGPPGPPDLQAQDLPPGLTTWKAPGDPSGGLPKAPTGRRHRPARPESRGILEPWGQQGPREKSEQTELPGCPASPAERAQLDPRDQKERRAPGETKETPGRTEWGSRASRDPLDPQGLSSMYQTERWRACQAPRAARGLQASPDRPGQRVTWAPKASQASRDPRARRASQAQSSAPTADH